MIVYFDESGDLGWNFGLPFRNGGSSRFLTIVFVLCPSESKKYIKRLLIKFYSHYGVSAGSEVKGSKLTVEQRNYLVNLVLAVLKAHPEISIRAITVNKENVAAHIRADANKLYNYMVGLALPDAISAEQTVSLNPDPRTIKVKSGNSLVDYLQIKLWFELNASTRLNLHEVPSHNSYGVQLADMIAHIVWSKYEDDEHEHADLLLSNMKFKRLFF